MYLKIFLVRVGLCTGEIQPRVTEDLDFSFGLTLYGGFPSSSNGKETACNAGDLGSIPGSGRSPGEGRGNPLQDSCLENPMDREAWWAIIHGVAKSKHD